MKTIEERAILHLEYERDFLGNDLSEDMVRRAYVRGATEQKTIDDEVIKKLNSIMEHSASVLGVGTKWFNENTRQAAIAELKHEIIKYLSDK